MMAVEMAMGEWLCCFSSSARRFGVALLPQNSCLTALTLKALTYWETAVEILGPLELPINRGDLADEKDMTTESDSTGKKKRELFDAKLGNYCPKRLKRRCCI